METKTFLLDFTSFCFMQHVLYNFPLPAKCRPQKWRAWCCSTPHNVALMPHLPPAEYNLLSNFMAECLRSWNVAQVFVFSTITQRILTCGTACQNRFTGLGSYSNPGRDGTDDNPGRAVCGTGRQSWTWRHGMLFILPASEIISIEYIAIAA